MIKVLVLLHLAALTKYDDLRTTRPSHRRTQAGGQHSERGSVTTEHVLWAVAVMAIVGIVVAAVTSYVSKQAGNIK